MPSCKTNINSLACFSLFDILSITEFWKIIAREYLFRCSFKFCTRGQWCPPVTVVQTPLSHIQHSFPKHLSQTNTEAARASRPASLLKLQLTVYTVGESSALQRLVSQIDQECCGWYAGCWGHGGVTKDPCLTLTQSSRASTLQDPVGLDIVQWGVRGALSQTLKPLCTPRRKGRGLHYAWDGIWWWPGRMGAWRLILT